MQAQEKSRTQFTSGRAGLASDWPRKQYVCSSVVRLVCTSIFSHLQSFNPGQNVWDSLLFLHKNGNTYWRTNILFTWPVGCKTCATRRELGSWFFLCLHAIECKNPKLSKDAEEVVPPPLLILSYQKSHLRWWRINQMKTAPLQGSCVWHSLVSSQQVM